jgi:hypothetical protein
MPTKCGLKDSEGYFCRWGGSGKKYYYDPKDNASKERARAKANEQGAAAHAGGYEGSEDKSIEEKKLPEVDEDKKPNPEEDEELEDEWKKCIPKSYDELEKGSYIIYKGKVSKILKVLEK